MRDPLPMSGMRTNRPTHFPNQEYPGKKLKTRPRVRVQIWWIKLVENRLMAVSLSVPNGNSPPGFEPQTFGPP